MKTFFNVEDLGDLNKALDEAQEVKKNRFGYQELGKKIEALEKAQGGKERGT